MPEDRPLLTVLGEHQRIGAIGPVALESAIEHSRRFVALLPETAETLVDLGSGGGLPGLVLAWDRPSLAVTLTDRREKRTDALRRSVVRLGWSDRVHVVTGDVARLGHEPAHAARYDVVTARSFGPPATTLAATSAFVRPGGTVLISESPTGERWVDVAREQDVELVWTGSHDGISVFLRP